MTADSLAITLIQPELYWENKAMNLAMLEGQISAITEQTEVVILPEMFSTGFSMQPQILAEKMNGPTIKWMERLARQYRIVLTGSVIIEEEGNYYNRLIWMLPNGQLGHYDKRHLFAFAGEHLHYAPGSRRFIASIKGWKINLQVCYDLRFPVWSRQTPDIMHEDNPPEPEYDLLVYVANWPEKRNTAWKTLLRARAIENQCFVAGVNRVGTDGNNIYHSGDSMIVDPLGNILYEKEKQPDVFTYTLKKETLTDVRSKFPFWKDADKFNVHQ